MRTIHGIAYAALTSCAMASPAWAQNAFPPFGNVGIGTDRPQSPLHIVANPSTRQIRMQDPFGFWEFWAGGNFHIRQGGTNDRLFISGLTGNVGIGTTSPVAKLHVTGDVLASGYRSLSDAKLKADVRPVFNALDTVQQIRGVSFLWNDVGQMLGCPAGRREVGVVAQEIEVVLPELVTCSEDGFKSVDYSGLTGVLIEAIKELRAEKDDQIAALTARVEALECSCAPCR